MMLKIFFIAIISFVPIVLVNITLASEYATEAWVAWYEGPGDSTDDPQSIAIDDFGNVYVTGHSYGGYNTLSDYATVKYDPDGNELWVARYNGPEAYDDGANSIAVDDEGNVYVTGGADLHGNGKLTDGYYATIKYDFQGNEIWVARYGQEGNWDTAFSLAVDDSGNVYVTGSSGTVKYDEDGNEQWTTIKGGRDIVVDDEGNVVVTDSSNGNRDYDTVKYDINGNELWEVTYDGPGNGVDQPHCVAVDDLGYVYVTGGSEGDDTNFDYATIKYDSEGNGLWVTRYNGRQSDRDIALSLVVDHWGNVSVTGTSGEDYWHGDYVTVKYDSEGSELWARRYTGPENGSDHAESIAVDDIGNLYVTGESEGSDTIKDFATVKYSPDGSELWLVRYDNANNSSDSACCIAVDDEGNVYVSGNSRGDYLTIKYVQGGSPDDDISAEGDDDDQGRG